MKFLLVVLCVALAGCATKVEPVLSDRYSDVPALKRIETPVTKLPETPKLELAVVEGESVAVLDIKGIDALTHFRTTARQNTASLESAISLYNAAVERDAIMLSSLRMEEERANLKEQQYVAAENARREQVQESRIELLIHKAFIVLIGIAWVL